MNVFKATADFEQWLAKHLPIAWPASYALDLVRLTTSAYLAIAAEHFGKSAKAMFKATMEDWENWRKNWKNKAAKEQD